MATTVVQLDPIGARYPTSNAGRLFWDAQGNAYIALDASTQQTFYLPFKMPQGVTGTLTAYVTMRMASATSGKVDMECLLQAVTPLDTFDTDAGQSFDTANGITAPTVPGTAGYVFEVSCTLTNADSYAAGDWCVLAVRRDATDATNDTATGDAHVLWVEIQK